ncbi:MAG: DNA-directed RNA polymerase subunit P [Candidatus Methanomethylicia archaeon]
MSYYKCMNCGRIIKPEELSKMRGVRCIYCRSKLIIKLRPPIVKVVKAI